MKSLDLCRQAFAAILRGDYAERDRLCDEAKKEIVREAELAPPAIIATKMPDGSFLYTTPPENKGR